MKSTASEPRLNVHYLTAATINTRPIALQPRKSNLSFVDINRRKAVNVVL